jgi:hypothetical protein
MAPAGNQKYLGESMIHVWQNNAKMPRLANRLRLRKAIDGRGPSAAQPWRADFSRRSCYG